MRCDPASPKAGHSWRSAHGQHIGLAWGSMEIRSRQSESTSSPVPGSDICLPLYLTAGFWRIDLPSTYPASLDLGHPISLRGARVSLLKALLFGTPLAFSQRSKAGGRSSARPQNARKHRKGFSAGIQQISLLQERNRISAPIRGIRRPLCVRTAQC